MGTWRICPAGSVFERQFHPRDIANAADDFGSGKSNSTAEDSHFKGERRKRETREMGLLTLFTSQNSIEVVGMSVKKEMGFPKGVMREVIVTIV